MVLCEATYDDIPTLVTLIHTAFEEYRGRLEPPSGAHRETAQSIGTYLQQGHAVLCGHGEASFVAMDRLGRT
jgi:hypothetical protein